MKIRTVPLFVAVNVIMSVITCLTLLAKPLSIIAYNAFVISMFAFPVWIALFVVTGVISYKHVKRNEKRGAVLSCCGGFIGGIAAVRHNRDYPYVRRVFLAANIWLYFIVGYPLATAILFSVGIYNVL